MTDALQQCINYGGCTKRQKLLSLVHPSLGIRPGSEPIVRPCKAPRQQVTLKSYTGNNAQVIELKKYLNTYLLNDLHAALVHGSLATNDEVAYSDFDALLIVKDEVLQDEVRLRKVAKRLCRAQYILRKQDALQHHGWMLLGAFELLNYDPNFLPVETLSCARSILGDAPAHLEIALSNKVGSKEFVAHLCGSIASKLKHPRLYKSAYFLKALLSELMLVPAAVYQTKFGVGLYKKDSFELMKPHFSSMEWSAVETATEIRRIWPVYRSSEILFLNAINPLLAANRAKRKNWKIPMEITEKLNERFFKSTLAFLDKSNQIVSA